MRSSIALAFGFALVLASGLSGCSDDDDAGDNGDASDGDPGDAGDDDDGDNDDGGGPSACGEIEGRCVELSPSDDDRGALQTALIEAQPDDVIFLRAGEYRFASGLSLDVDRVTLRGEGDEQTVLSFAEQSDGAQGLLVTADDFTIEDLAFEDTAGDALKIQNSARVVVRGVRAEWTGGPSQENGAYGIYPVQCTDVLIEFSTVRGASDAGIYVGQTERAVVRNNAAENNVAGIEIENTFEADVYDNIATGNTGGILVFNLPGLQVRNGAGTRVFNNEIVDNNEPNFASGGTVALVPPGTGFVALAAHKVEVFENRFANNQTVQLGVISYHLTLAAWEDETYDPYSDTLYFHDNTFEGGGDMPAGALGGLVRNALDTLPDPPATVPDIVIDGHFDPAKVDQKSGEVMPAFNICLQANEGADFASLGFNGNIKELAPSLDAAPRNCTHPALPAVELDGVPL